MKVVGLSDRGLKRSKNEDAYLIKESWGLYVICDGMGGHRGGDVASRLAIKTINSCFEDDSSEKNISLLNHGIHQANKVIWEQGCINPEWHEMGTTITAALINGLKLEIAHVGDSGCYHFRAGLISKITRDHTLAQKMVDQGIIKTWEKRQSSYNHILTRALGVDEHVLVDNYEHELLKGDLLLLCSDGLSDMLEEAEILKIASNFDGDLNETASKLLQQTLDRGGYDNISLILIRI
ncbi:MAG: Stp1/IreP family PP2C-type Ser/Thr phosphatase [Syntrophomonas sp.]|uniref:Stp1/IreP family PP2C-type Ser/Thr phosphatase n=1 Tax=Syntrophomonas sp. TaxID=2053627 RepID=UPI00262E49E1|nr:Stp1/IreP family PP2C-type Ser/Thr phosphatase [Syntrophomonas sp.]MDD2509732.1 Stp1/IreP family PP2C-type Ser/Thr phosphatase [Syntrophomonas sp.]MDD4625864.1 Stp1/IreP family PP2C-type Ser/Thr phosphatase [Syntrophomonas sp.]